LPAEKLLHVLAVDENNFAVTLGILAQKISVCGNLFQENSCAEKFQTRGKNSVKY
jgi:hypothetical protein